MQRVRRAPTSDLTARDLAQIRRLMDAAFAGDEHGGFDDDDWTHALGGVHFMVEMDDAIVAHASVVERELHLAGRPVRTGYVEAVGTSPARQRSGLGTAVMRDVNAYLDEHFELGALGTGSHGFYERLGWTRWRGPSFVRQADGRVQRTRAEDGYIMVRRTAASPALDLDEPISCDWRPGDVW